MQKLAERTSDSAKEIKGIVGVINEAVAETFVIASHNDEQAQEGNLLAQNLLVQFEQIKTGSIDTSLSIKELFEHIEMVNQICESAAAAVERTLLVSEKNAEIAGQVAESAKQEDSVLKEMATNASDLVGAASKLYALVQHFKAA